MKGGQTRNTEAYLCGSTPVQNTLLEPCAYQQGYAARVVSPESPEEGAVTKEPGRGTSGDGISAWKVCQLPPLNEALGTQPCGSLRRWRCGYRRRTLRVKHVAAWRKWHWVIPVRFHVVRMFGKPSL